MTNLAWDQPSIQVRPIPESIPPVANQAESFDRSQQQVAPGQIWLAKDVPGLLLIVERLQSDGLYAAYPLSTETAYMSDNDVWLSEIESPVGSPFMVLAWLQVAVDNDALDCHVANLPEDIVRLVRRVSFRSTQGDVEIEPAGLARVGPPLTDSSDPRYDFQQREMERWEPASVRATRRMLSEDDDEDAATAEVAATAEAGPASESIQGWLLGGSEALLHICPPVSTSEPGRIEWEKWPTEWQGQVLQILIPGSDATEHLRNVVCGRATEVAYWQVAGLSGVEISLPGGDTSVTEVLRPIHFTSKTPVA